MFFCNCVPCSLWLCACVYTQYFAVKGGKDSIVFCSLTSKYLLLNKYICLGLSGLPKFVSITYQAIKITVP